MKCPSEVVEVDTNHLTMMFFLAIRNVINVVIQLFGDFVCLHHYQP
jgi:hypothetical protein